VAAAAAAAEETTVAVGDMEEDINFKWLKEIFLECCPSVDWGSFCDNILDERNDLRY